MTSRFLNLLFSPSVKAAQDRHGSRKAYAARDSATAPDLLTQNEAHFIATRDSAYLATIGADGWPYIQHRGGPAGFIKVLNNHAIGFADYRGNRQYISVGNLADDDRVSLFMMDYPNRARLKMLGRARIVDLAGNPDLAAILVDQNYRAKVERGIVIEIEAFDWNCPQHIEPRYTMADIEPAIAKLKARIVELETAAAHPPPS